MQNNVIGHYEGTAVYDQGDLCYYAWNTPKNKRNPPSRWHHGNSEEQKIHAERFCVVKHLLYRREIILINMYNYTKCDAYVNWCVILTEERM